MRKEVQTPDHKARVALIDLKDRSYELRYKNDATGKKWTQKRKPYSLHVYKMAISDDGRFVVIWTGYHMRRGDSEEELLAYDEDGKCVYTIMPQEGWTFRDDFPQEIAALLASGDSEVELLRIKQDCERFRPD